MLNKVTNQGDLTGENKVTNKSDQMVKPTI